MPTCIESAGLGAANYFWRMEPAPSLTNRGFGLLRFVDTYGRDCSVQESSVVPCLWVGADDQGVRMHLSQRQVRDLLPYLEHFAAHGWLGIEDVEQSENAPLQ